MFCSNVVQTHLIMSHNWRFYPKIYLYTCTHGALHGTLCWVNLESNSFTFSPEHVRVILEHNDSNQELDGVPGTQTSHLLLSY